MNILVSVVAHVYNKVCINSLLCEGEILDEEYDKLFIPDPCGTPYEKILVMTNFQLLKCFLITK